MQNEHLPEHHQSEPHYLFLTQTNMQKQHFQTCLQFRNKVQQVFLIANCKSLPDFQPVHHHISDQNFPIIFLALHWLLWQQPYNPACLSVPLSYSELHCIDILKQDNLYL